MDILNQFIKYIKLDDEKRILVSVQNHFEAYLKESETKKMIKEMAQKSLGDNFVQLEIGKNVCRVTVKEGTEESSMELIQTELLKGLEMAMAFMQQMSQNAPSEE